MHIQLLNILGIRLAKIQGKYSVLVNKSFIHIILKSVIKVIELIKSWQSKEV